MSVKGAIAGFVGALIGAVDAPLGKGIYARGDLLEPGRLIPYLREGRYDWVAVTPNILRRSGDALREAKIPVWIYETPEAWLPSRWQATLAEHIALARRYDCRGIICDAETGWSRASDYGTEARRVALAQGLVRARRDTGLSIGLTTFYAHSGWRVWGPICGSDVWLNLQMYDSGRTADRNREIIAEVAGAGWKVPDLPAIASYRHLVGAEDPGPGVNVTKLTPAQFQAYIAKFPPLRGACIWYPLPAPTGALGEAIARWKPNPLPIPWWGYAGAIVMVLAVVGYALFSGGFA